MQIPAIDRWNMTLVVEIATRFMEGAMEVPSIHGWQGSPWMEGQHPWTGQSTDGMQHSVHTAPLNTSFEMDSTLDSIVDSCVLQCADRR